MSEQVLKGSAAAIDTEALKSIASGYTVEAEESAAPEIETSEILLPVISLGFDVFSPNWGITEEEKKALSNGYGELIDKYFPDGVGSVGVELNALILTGAIFLPRMSVPRKVEEKKQDEQTIKEPEKGSGGNQGGGGLFDVEEKINGETLQ